MKVVLSGYFGFDNIGDEAILHSMIKSLREFDKTVEITVLSNEPEKTERVYDVKAINRWKLTDVFKVIRQSDGLFSGGGSLLQDKTSGKSVIYYCGVMWLAKLARKPVIIYAQGMGPLKKLKSRKIVKASLNRSAMVSVRDEVSKQLLIDIGVKKQIDVVPDPVMGMTLSFDHSQEWVSKNLKSKDFITIAIRDWPDGKDYLNKLADSFSELVNEGYQLVFLPMHGEKDNLTAERMIANLRLDSGKPQPLLFPYDASVEAKAALAGSSMLLIGMRLHALIFAAVGRRPFVAISYDPKIDAFARLCNQKVAVNVEDNQWTAETLTSVIKEYLNNLDAKEKKLGEYVEQAKQATTKSISKAYKHLSK